MKQIILYLFISFVVCSCRRTIYMSAPVPKQEVIFLSPITLIEMKMAEAMKKSMAESIENKMAESAEKNMSDEDTRCSIYDNECQKNFFQNIAVKFAPTGIPELGIPVLDPYKLTNVSLSILGLLDLTLVEGDAEGIGKCVVTKFVTNVDARYREPTIVCKQIVIKGTYKLTSKSVVGEVCDWCNVHGEGNLNIVLDDWNFRFRYPFRIVRRTDGQIYLNGLFDKANYETDVRKVTVSADYIYVGKRDISHSVVSFINRHWKAIMHSNIGKFIYDKSAQYYYDVYRTFFDKSPANTYLKDDLSPLIDN